MYKHICSYFYVLGHCLVEIERPSWRKAITHSVKFHLRKTPFSWCLWISWCLLDHVWKFLPIHEPCMGVLVSALTLVDVLFLRKQSFPCLSSIIYDSSVKITSLNCSSFWMQVWQNSKRTIWFGIRINWQYLGPHLVQPSFCRTFLMVCVEIFTSNVLTSIFCRSKDKFNKHSQHPLIRRPIIRTFANSNWSLIPFLLFTFKIHPIIRTFAISNIFFGPVGVRINRCLL